MTDVDIKIIALETEVKRLSRLIKWVNVVVLLQCLVIVKYVILR